MCPIEILILKEIDAGIILPTGLTMPYFVVC
jgi:hypothetical protein